MIKLARQALYRIDDVDRVRLSDFFMVEIPDTAIGRDACQALVIVSRGGKTNTVSSHAAIAFILLSS